MPPPPHQDLPILLLTRSQTASHKIAAQVADRLGHAVPLCISELVEILPVKCERPSDGAYAAVFTSSNGVLYAPAGAGRSAYCVGDATAKAAKAAGYKAFSAGGDADALVEMLAHVALDGPVIHFSGDHTRGDVVARLAAQGKRAERRIVYRQSAKRLSAEAQQILSGPKKALVGLFSPNAARAFLASAEMPFQNTTFACLSSNVAAELGAIDASVLIAANPDVISIVDTICGFYSDFPPP